MKSKFAFIPARFLNIAFAFYMAGIMAFLMSICLVLVNTGWQGDVIGRIFKSYIVAMPIAFISVMFVRPVVVKLIALTVKPPQNPSQ